MKICTYKMCLDVQKKVSFFPLVMITVQSRFGEQKGCDELIGLGRVKVVVQGWYPRACSDSSQPVRSGFA